MVHKNKKKNKNLSNEHIFMCNKMWTILWCHKISRFLPSFGKKIWTFSIQSSCTTIGYLVKAIFAIQFQLFDVKFSFHVVIFQMWVLLKQLRIGQFSGEEMKKATNVGRITENQRPSPLFQQKGFEKHTKLNRTKCDRNKIIYMLCNERRHGDGNGQRTHKRSYTTIHLISCGRDWTL